MVDRERHDRTQVVKRERLRCWWKLFNVRHRDVLNARYRIFVFRYAVDPLTKFYVILDAIDAGANERPDDRNDGFLVPVGFCQLSFTLVLLAFFVYEFQYLPDILIL